MKALQQKTLFLTIFFSIVAAGFAQASSSGISLNRAADEAQRLAAHRPGWSVMLGSGSSMNPHYGNGDIVIVDDSNLKSIRPGMIAVYKDNEGDLVGHTVVAVTPDGLRVKGINNSGEDSELVNSSNYRGVVVGILRTDGRGSVSLPTVIGKRQ